MPLEKTDNQQVDRSCDGERALALAVVHQAVQDVEFNLRKIRRINAKILELRAEGKAEKTTEDRRREIIKELGSLIYKRGYYTSEVKYDWRWIFGEAENPRMTIEQICVWNEIDVDYMRDKIRKKFRENRQKELKKNGRDHGKRVD